MICFMGDEKISFRDISLRDMAHLALHALTGAGQLALHVLAGLRFLARSALIDLLDDAGDRLRAGMWTSDFYVPDASDVLLPDHVGLPVDAAPNGLGLRLGVALDDTGHHEWIWWDPDATDPHVLVCGLSKSGKTILLRCLLSQALAGGWDTIISDPKGLDYRWTDGLPGVERFAGDGAFGALDRAVAVMRGRQAWMASHAPATATNLGEVLGHPFKPCLVLLDKANVMLELGGEGEPADQKRRKALNVKEFGDLARLSRAMQMVMCVEMQRPDGKFLEGEARSNLGTRVLTGEGTSAHKLMAFDTAEVAPLPKDASRGRARVAVGGGKPREFQVPWISTDAIHVRYRPPDDDGLAGALASSPPHPPSPPINGGA